MSVAEVDFVARAPDGKEVEELTRKEITKSLRSKVPIDQITGNRTGREGERDRRPDGRDRDRGRDGRRDEDSRRREEPRRSFERPQPPVQPHMTPPVREPVREPIREQRPPEPRRAPEDVPSPSQIGRQMSRPSSASSSPPPSSMGGGVIAEVEADDEGLDTVAMIHQPKKEDAELAGRFGTVIGELKNTLRGRLYDADGGMISEVPIRELIRAVEDSKNAYAIVFDGIITQRLVELANRQGIRVVYGIRASQLSRRIEGMQLYTVEQGKL